MVYSSSQEDGRGNPSVTVVIPPGKSTPSRRMCISPGSRWAGFFSDVSIGTTQEEVVTSNLSRTDCDKRQQKTKRYFFGSRRLQQCLYFSFIIIVLGLLMFGIYMTIGLMQQEGRKGMSSKSRGKSEILVGAYYYPWHGENFHNGDGYIRNELESQQLPALGEYDDSNPDTVAQHLEWSRQANIGLWITSWWGPNRLEDTSTKDVIMRHQNLGNMMVALHYETSNRMKGGIKGITADIEYMCDNYFDHPNYYKVDGRAVLFVYVTRKLEQEGTLESTILAMRTAANKRGYSIFLVGDQIFDAAPSKTEVYKPFWYLDAVTNYDVYGAMGRPSPYAGSEVVDKYYDEQAKWREQAQESGCRYVPSATPGYNDRGVRLHRDNPPLSRKLTAESSEGSLFAYQLRKARELVDLNMDNLIMINSFNEWHEDTQIEPVIGDSTNQPYDMTKGLSYEGYGELYLDILWNATQPVDSQLTSAMLRSGGR